MLAQLAKKLQDDLGLAEEAAIWAVESWALALEVISVVSPSSPSQSQKEPSRSKEETHQINNPVKVNPETQKEEQERQRVEKERFDAENQARVETERKQRQQVEKQRFEKEKAKEKAKLEAETKTRRNNRIVVVLLGFCLCLGWLGGTIIFYLVQPQKSIIIGNSSASPSASSSASPNEAATAPSLNELAFPQLPRLNGAATVEMKLKYGTVTIEVDGIDAPITAGNFVDLVKRGVYNNLTFHRVIREPSPFVAQGGDPLGNGTGSFIDPATSQPRLIPLEITKAYTPKEGFIPKPEYSNPLKPDDKVQLRHIRGAVAMARFQLSPDSASSQFYIALADINFLDGSYAVFGYVTSGMDVVDKIKLGDRIESMTVTKGIENLKTMQ